MNVTKYLTLILLISLAWGQNGGDDFRKGYKKELINLRIESMNKGLNHFLIGAGGLSCYLIFGLIAYGI